MMSKEIIGSFKPLKGIIWNNLSGVSCGIIILLIFPLFHSCESFYNPDLGTGLRSDEFFKDESEFRAAAMGMYALQQKLVEQIVILGELRSDLLKVTEYAENNLREIQNFNISPDNPYASPRDFYRLIAATHSFIRKLEYHQPHVMDKDAPVNNYDRYYGEALCMRAWAFFNAARIYGSIPYIPIEITSISEIEDYVNSPKTIISNYQIIYALNGYNNDTIRVEKTYEFDRAFIDIPAVIDTFTRQLKTKVKAVGVNHRMTNNDVTWDATVWGNFSMQALLGQMYLTLGDYVQAMAHFNPILYNNDVGFGNVRFGLDNTFRNANWSNIHTTINLNEHILVLRFNKADRQLNQLQYLFSNIPPNSYQMKPTRAAVDNWEGIWDNYRLIDDPNNPGFKITDTLQYGVPGDFYRGCMISYNYFSGNQEFTEELFRNMLEFKRVQSTKDVTNIMEGVDTVVTKYSFSKTPYSHDADFIIYRAASIHLYAAEIRTYWGTPGGAGGGPPLNIIQAERFLNDGSYQSNNQQLGVRGRVGFANGAEYVTSSVDRIYLHNPFTNLVIGNINITSLGAKQLYLEDKIIEERARELAFEGERFYDLMRVAKRRNDPSFLADKVAAKFESPQKEQIRALLMNESNWYVPFYLGNNAKE